MSGTCVFCGIIASNEPHHEVVWKDDTYVAFLTTAPLKEGHMLVVPHSHVDHIFDLPADEYAGLMEVARRLGGALHNEMKSTRVDLVVSGYHVPHTHVHLIPTDHGNEICLPKQNPSPEELAKVGERLRSAFLNV